MLVVKKTKIDGAGAGAGAGTGTDIMTMRLFEDSERRILKSLENGLQDFAEGRLRRTGASSTSTPTPSKELAEVKVEEEEWNLDDFETLDEHLDRTAAADADALKTETIDDENRIGSVRGTAPEKKIKK